MAGLGVKRRLVRWGMALLPLVLLVALWIPGIDQGGFRVDTGLYSAIALYAYESGDLVALHAGDQPYFNKPPLAFWIHGAFLRALGPELWVARLPALLAAMGTVLATMGTARLLAGWRAALAAGLVLATTLEFFRFARAFSLDLWLTLCLALALVPAAKAVRSGRDGWLVAAGVPVGLSLLVKPALGLFTLVVLAVWLAWMGRARRGLWLVPAAGVALLVALPWHLAMHAQFGMDFWNAYLLRESVGRATGSSFEAEPPWFFPAHLARTYWPWLLVLIAAMVTWARQGSVHPDASRGGLERLGWSGFLLWLAVLSAFAGKHTRYFVHVYPYLALVCGAWLAGRVPGRAARRLRRTAYAAVPVALTGSIILAAIGVRVHDPPRSHWLEFYAFLDGVGSEPLWVGPHVEMRGTSCNVYLRTGRWPRTAHVDRAIAAELGIDANPVAGVGPGVGELMVFRRDGSLGPREVDEVVFESGPIAVVRIEAAWDGRLPVLEREEES